jgi:hypothetical protein
MRQSIISALLAFTALTSSLGLLFVGLRIDDLEARIEALETSLDACAAKE